MSRPYEELKKLNTKISNNKKNPKSKAGLKE